MLYKCANSNSHMGRWFGFAQAKASPNRRQLSELWKGGFPLAGTEIVLVKAVGDDQLLATELVGLAGCRGAEVGDHCAVWVVGDGLFDGAGGAVDHGAVVAEVVLSVVVECRVRNQYTFIYSSHESGYLRLISLRACSGISVSR